MSILLRNQSNVYTFTSLIMKTKRNITTYFKTIWCHSIFLRSITILQLVSSYKCLDRLCYNYSKQKLTISTYSSLILKINTNLHILRPYDAYAYRSIIILQLLSSYKCFDHLCYKYCQEQTSHTKKFTLLLMNRTYKATAYRSIINLP